MGQNRKKHRINSHLIIHFPTSEGVSEFSERANEWVQQSMRAKQAGPSKFNEWAVRANEQTDKRVAQYSNLYFLLFWPTVHGEIAEYSPFCHLCLPFLPPLESFLFIIFTIFSSLSILPSFPRCFYHHLFLFVAGTRPISHRVGRSVGRSVAPSFRRSVGLSHFAYFAFLGILRVWKFVIEICPCPNYYCPCPTARDRSSRIYGLVIIVDIFFSLSTLPYFPCPHLCQLCHLFLVIVAI